MRTNAWKYTKEFVEKDWKKEPNGTGYYAVIPKSEHLLTKGLIVRAYDALGKVINTKVSTYNDEIIITEPTLEEAKLIKSVVIIG